MARSTKFVAGFALEAAESFRLAGLESAPRQGIEPRSVVGDLVTGAVNLSFSLELYLKALALLTGRHPKPTHELDKLFDQLPGELQAAIEEAYLQHLQANPKDKSELGIQDFHVSPDPTELKDGDFIREKADPTLSSLLQEHSKAFQLWRYIHEMPEDLRFSYFFDFRAMNALLDSVKQFADQIAEAKGEVIEENAGPPPEDWGEKQ